ncbi:hypothetical protein [Lacimicrobium alkaliphilum]
MASRRPVWLAAIISSIIFGASHIIPSQAISAAPQIRLKSCFIRGY